MLEEGSGGGGPVVTEADGVVEVKGDEGGFDREGGREFDELTEGMAEAAAGFRGLFTLMMAEVLPGAFWSLKLEFC